jgi:hypothetical protein
MADFVDLLRTNRNYRCTWLGQVGSEIGDYFNNIAIFSLILQMQGRLASDLRGAFPPDRCARPRN